MGVPRRDAEILVLSACAQALSLTVAAMFLDSGRFLVVHCCLLLFWDAYLIRECAASQLEITRRDALLVPLILLPVSLIVLSLIDLVHSTFR